MARKTEVSGIFQGDVILRTAVIRGLRQLREDPSLLDDMLQSLPEDELTAGRYGEKTIEQCKDWLTKTDIKVKLGLLVNQADLPCVAIGMAQNQEAETTLGDMHYVPGEVDPDDPTSSRQVHSLHENQTYTLGCFVHGEAELCLFLYSALLFVLLRNKEDLLEPRGFELSTVTTGAFAFAQMDIENVYQRAINITGKVTHSWPGKKVQSGTSGKVEAVITNTPSTVVAAGATVDSGPETRAALMEKDMLAGVTPYRKPR